MYDFTGVAAILHRCSRIMTTPSNGSRDVLWTARAILVVAVLILLRVSNGPLFTPLVKEDALWEPRIDGSPSIVLFTAIFGTESANAKHLPFFLKTVETSGFDVIIFGYPKPPFVLPANVKYIPMTWLDFCRFVSRKLFDGKQLDILEQVTPYKIIDFKPMFGHLFKQYIQTYEFWGYCDNDLLLGQSRTFLHRDFLDNFDVVSGMEGQDGEMTWGPFTLMRNVKKVNELFLKVPGGVENIINSWTTYFFDEWGGGSRDYYNTSMTQLLTEHRERLGIRWHGGFPIGWDGACRNIDKPRCSECVFTENNGQGLLTWNRSLIEPDAEYLVYEVLLCHFQFGKKIVANQSAPPQSVLSANPFYYSYPEGFRK